MYIKPITSFIQFYTSFIQHNSILETVIEYVLEGESGANGSAQPTEDKMTLQEQYALMLKKDITSTEAEKAYTAYKSEPPWKSLPNDTKYLWERAVAAVQDRQNPKLYLARPKRLEKFIETFETKRGVKAFNGQQKVEQHNSNPKQSGERATAETGQSAIDETIQEYESSESATIEQAVQGTQHHESQFTEWDAGADVKSTSGSEGDGITEQSKRSTEPTGQSRSNVPKRITDKIKG